MAHYFDVVFNRTNRQNSSGLYTISIRATINRKTTYFNPGLSRIESKHWTGKENKWVSDRHRSHFEFNQAIKKKVAELYEYADKLALTGKPLTLNIMREFFERRGDKTSVNDYVNEYIRTYKFNAIRTKKKYQTFEKLLNDFNPDIKFVNLEERLFLNFRDFLLETKEQAGNTVEKYFEPFKKIIKDAVRRDYLPRNPFENVELRIPKSQTNRVALFENEIDQIRNLSFPESDSSLSEHRDVFVFQCYSGLYYSDIQQLRKSQVQLIDGKRFILGNRAKNGLPFTIPIYFFPEGENILIEKLTKVESDNDLVFYTIEEPPYNRALKRIAAMAGISKSISNKTARHSFTDILVSRNISETTVKAILGHEKKSQVFTNYYEQKPEHMIKSLEA
ncbi:site-specific integrase [Roseivirga thermotolerans]|uniref:site-specific integrase n=1 Tax=Roseivirga thermotolerans TaxID=1758176 RepID=UPI00273FFE31|nr:site-specific integrase [Roseivirga thermotolerans]